MSIPLNGKQIKLISKSRTNIDKGHLKHTREVVTEPLPGVSTTISPFISDIARPNLEAQVIAIKQCVECNALVVILLFLVDFYMFYVFVCFKIIYVIYVMLLFDLHCIM